MLLIWYLYPCGHTEAEIFDTNSIISEKKEEQTVVMNRVCVSCKQPAEQDEPCELALEEGERWVEVAW